LYNNKKYRKEKKILVLITFYLIMKNLFFILQVVLILFIFSPANSQEKNTTYFPDDDTLTISGFGEIYNTLTPTMQNTLDEYVKFLSDNSNIIIRIEGHSDNRGTAKQNHQRSIDRAKAVNDYLTSQGIPQNRIY